MHWASRSVTGAAPPWRDRMRQLLETSYFRQAASMAFIFLLVTLVSMSWGRSLIENVMFNHVREMVLGDVRAQHVAGATTVQALRAALETRDRVEQSNERQVLLVDAQQRVVYGSAALLQVMDCRQPGCHGWRHADWIADTGEHYELLGMVVPLPDGGMYFSAYNILPMLERVRVLPLTAGAGLFVVLLFSVAASVRFGGESLRHIDRIRRVLRRYARGDSQIRVPLKPQRDEFDQLGENINQALERINRLMEEVKSVTSHIAHELGTPLTRLQHRLSNAMEQTGDAAVHDELSQAMEEAERIQRLSRSILRIGEIESGRHRREFQPLDVEALLRDVADYHEPLADLRGNVLMVDAQPGQFVLGDRSLMVQALSNLVDNALKYALPGTPITLFSQVDGVSVRVGVADCGPGIADDQKGMAVQRFNRLEQHAKGVSGYGLGLTLVQAIARLHGGELRLRDNPRPASSDTPISTRGLRAFLELKRHAGQGA